MSSLFRARRARVASVAAVVFALTSPLAYSETVTFNFSGTLLNTITFDGVGHVTQDFSVAGQLVSGSLRVTSEGLFADQATYPDSTMLSYYDSARDSVVRFSSTLSINGVPIDFGSYPFVSGTVDVVDSSPPGSCDPGVNCNGTPSDQISVAQVSSEVLPGAAFIPDGTYLRRALGIVWYDAANPFGFVDLAGIDSAEDALEYPIGPNRFGTFTTWIYECLSQTCSTVTETHFNFNIDSLTREITPVPLPGGLILLSSALVGLGGCMRRVGRNTSFA